MDKRPEVTGTIVTCTSPTPGIFLNTLYEIVMVETHPIMGPLVRVRDHRSGLLLSHAYYPWRFTLPTITLQPNTKARK